MTAIRDFEENDLGEIVNIAGSALNTDYDPRLYISLHEMWPQGFLIAEENGRILGFIAGIMSHEADARVLMIAVKGEFRRRGVGRNLMNAFMNNCTLRGAKRIYLEVRKDNRGAIEFYRSMGFSAGATLPAYYDDGKDALIMWKSL